MRGGRACWRKGEGKGEGMERARVEELRGQEWRRGEGKNGGKERVRGGEGRRPSAGAARHRVAPSRRRPSVFILTFFCVPHRAGAPPPRGHCSRGGFRGQVTGSQDWAQSFTCSMFHVLMQYSQAIMLCTPAVPGPAAA